VTAKKICVTKISPKNNQVSLLHQAFPIERSNAMVSFQPPEFSWWRDGWKSRGEISAFFASLPRSTGQILENTKNFDNSEGYEIRQMKKSCPTNMHAVSQRKS